jgi:outer membrane protein OmpA-like peptidoglycan-associated protein
MILRHLLFVLIALFISSSLPAQFNYRNVASIDDLTLNGDARKLQERIRLVPAEFSRRGSVWFNAKQRIVDGFESTFSFQITEPGSNPPWVPGADGLAFVIQNSSVYEGGAGGGIGYQGIRNSLAVEFDTYDNNPDGNPEPNGNHISVHSRGLEPNDADHRGSLGWSTRIADLKDGTRHTARVRYLPGTLEVYLDDLEHPAVTVAIRLDTLLQLDDGRCWMGFTAATGGSWANFDLFSLNSEVILNIRNIYFDYDRSILKPASYPELRKLAQVLKEDPELKAEIRGHTDSHGGEEYNQRLSQSRADAVVRYLVKLGITPQRLVSHGYGADTPIATNETDEGRAENRRVEARLFKE